MELGVNLKVGRCFLTRQRTLGRVQTRRSVSVGKESAFFFFFFSFCIMPRAQGSKFFSTHTQLPYLRSQHPSLPSQGSDLA